MFHENGNQKALFENSNNLIIRQLRNRAYKKRIYLHLLRMSAERHKYRALQNPLIRGKEFLLFRQNLNYLSFRPKIEKCT